MKKECLLTSLNLSIPSLYFQIKIYDENWFCIVHGIEGRSGQNGQTLLCPVQGYTLLRSRARVNTKLLLECLGPLWPSADAEEWSLVTGEMIVTLGVIIVVVEQRISHQQRLPVNFPCLHFRAGYYGTPCICALGQALDAAGH